MILNSVEGSDSCLPQHAMTVDFVPGSEKTEPSPAIVNRPTKPVLIGRFEVIGVLGSGSFGTVYRAYDPLLDRDVALKVPRFAADKDSGLERFHREARAAARLHHPNIVTLYENGESESGPYLVSEFVDGIPLNRLLQQQRLGLRETVDLVRQIAEALYYAHTEGIVHRDVKPSNIMMNSAGRTQVMDFGLAKRDADVESGMTIEGQIVGTPNYMAPEQARGAIAEIGPHSDQYSVGVVLYEMICGRPPFSGDPWTVIARVANVRENPPPPRAVRPDLPRDLEACCLKAMEKDPQARYPNLQAMADDLDHWLKGLPLVARPIGPVERIVRWCRHNRMIASLGGTIATLLLIAGIVGPWLAVQFRELATEAKHKAVEAESARDAEKNARLATERSIIDSYTETGLTAYRNNDPREALLWFANAVAISEHYPSREKQNRIRFQSWLSQVAIPLQAFDLPAAWKKVLCYHPSGRWLLTLAANGECQLLQLSDGQRQLLSQDGPVGSAAFSPDGKLLVMSSGLDVKVFEFDVDRTPATDGTSEAHSPASRHEIAQTKELDRWKHSDAVNELKFGMDGQLLVVGGANTVQVRDVPKKEFRTDPFEVGSQVTSVAMSPDSRRFAVRCNDQKVRLLASANDQTNSELLIPVQPATAVAMFPPLFVGNDRLVISDDYHSVNCWDLDKKEIVWTHKPKRVLSMAVSPDKKWIALGEDLEVVLLDTTTGEPAERRIKHSNLVSDLSFHPTSSMLLTACIENSAHVFQIPSGQSVGPAVLHSDAVHRCTWSPDGESFATVHWTGDLVRVWKPSVDRQEDTLVVPSASSPFVRINNLGNRWLFSGFDSWRDRTEVEIFDLKSGNIVGPKLSGPGLISDSDFIPKSPLVALVGGSTREHLGLGLPDQKLEGPGFIRLVNSETGEPAFDDVKTPSQPIAVRTSPDGQTIVVLCHHGHLLILDSSTGKSRAEHQAFGNQPAVHGFVMRDRIRFSPRGDQFILWGCNALAELRKTDTGELVATMQHDPGNLILDALFSPDGKLVATCSSDKSVRLWDSTTGSSTEASLKHPGWVFNAQFSQDGQRLLTASSDKQARIWDLKTRTAILATREHTDQVFSVTFLPGEELFLASTRDGQITAWDSSLGKMIAPVRKLTGMVYQLSRHAGSPRVIASGTIKQIHVVDWKQWIPAPEMDLSREDVRLIGEILSSQRVHQGGAATSLTSAEWIERWKELREKYPDGLMPKLSSRKSLLSD